LTWYCPFQSKLLIKMTALGLVFAWCDFDCNQ
jgi:hypothetical protein